MKHIHEYKKGRSGTVAVCHCGRFKFIGSFTPIVGMPIEEQKIKPVLVKEKSIYEEMKIFLESCNQLETRSL